VIYIPESPYYNVTPTGGFGALLVPIGADTTIIDEMLQKYNSDIDKKMEKMDVFKSDITLYFHVASGLLSELLGGQEKSLGLMVAQSAISVGLSSVAVYRIIKEIAEASLGQQWIKVGFLTVLAGLMGWNIVQGQVIKFQAIAKKGQAEALRSQVERYTL